MTALVTIFELLVGLMFVVMGYRRGARFSALHERCTGTVTDTWQTAENATLPIVSYVTADGSTVEFAGELLVYWSKPKIGSHVPVRYTAADPQGARIDTFRGTNSSPVLLVLLGVAFIVAGVLNAI